jgi:hypothetical protein
MSHSSAFTYLFPWPAMRPPAKPTCTILVAYDDRAAAQKGMDVYYQLFHRFEGDFEFRCNLWRFDVLGDAAMQRIAVRDATQADLIVLSTRTLADLPEPVKAWIETWSPRKLNTDSALVWLSSRTPGAVEGPRSLAQYLREVAQRSGMEFFAYAGEEEAGAELERACFNRLPGDRVGAVKAGVAVGAQG